MTTTPTITHLNEDGSVTREWMLGHADPASVKHVTLSRVCLEHRGRPWTWLYLYKPEGGLEREYGQGLASAWRFLRRAFPNATITETWER